MQMIYSIGSQVRHLVRYDSKKVTHHFYVSRSSIVSFYAKITSFLPFHALLPSAILRWKMFAFSHLLLNLFSSVGQKKRQTETSVKKQSHCEFGFVGLVLSAFTVLFRTIQDLECFESAGKLTCNMDVSSVLRVWNF